MYVFYKPAKNVIDYIVNIKVYNKDSEEQTNNLSYTCSISFIKESFNGYIVNIKRREMLLNNTKDHSSIKELVLISGEVMNNLSLEVSQYGQIMKVKNMKEIQEYWKKIKYKIEKTYVGDIVTPIVDSIEKKIHDEKLFIQSLNKDPFIHNYFGIIYGEYKNNLRIINDEITGFNKEPLDIKWRNKVKTFENEDIHIISIGTIEEKQNIASQKQENVLDFKFCSSFDFTAIGVIKKMEVFYTKKLQDFLVKEMILNVNLKK